ncbi:MAG: tetratricopeptide repeat protein [Thermodesulfobacteriota bacterium]
MAQKDKILAKAQQFLEKGRIDKAAAEYKAVIAIDPADVTVRLRLGELYSKLGNKDEAINEYNEVAKIHTKKGFYLKAIAVYKQILKLDESSLEVHNKLADLYTKQRLIADAITEFSYIVNVYEKKARTNDAFELVKKMVSLDPENMGVKLRLADMHLKLGYDKDAKAEYKWVYDKLMSQGKFDKAEKIYFELYKANQRDPELTEGLAEIQKKLGNKKEFLKYSYSLLDIYSDEKDKLKQACESILTVVPTDGRAISVLGRLKGETPFVESKPFLAPSEPLVEFPSVGVSSGKPKEEPLIDFPPVGHAAGYPSEGWVGSGKESAEKEESIIEFPKVEDVLEDIEFSLESPAGEAPQGTVPDLRTERSGVVESGLSPELQSKESFEISIEPPTERQEAITEESAESFEISIEPPTERQEAITEESGESFEISIEPPAEEEIAHEAEALEAESLEITAEEETPPVVLHEPEVMPEAAIETVEIAEAPYSYEKQPGEAETPRPILRMGTPQLEGEDVGLSSLFGGSGMGGLNDVSAALNEGEEAPEAASIDSGYVDLSKEFGLDEALDKLVGSWTGEEKQETFEEFKAGVGEQLGREDVETHYNLGIAYMEMELFDDAIREFKLSLKSPALEFDAYTRLVHCAMGTGAIEEAVSYGLKALKIKGRSDEERKGVMYELGLAYEAAGKTNEAKDMYRSVIAIDPAFRDVADKMTDLDTGARLIPMENDDMLEVELL